MEECRGTTRLCVSECSKSTSLVFADIDFDDDNEDRDETKGYLLGIAFTDCSL